MRVLHIIPSLEIGGAERLTFDICNELDSRENIEVKLIIFRNINEFGDRPFITHVPASIRLSLTKPNKTNVSKLQEEINSFKPDIIHSHLFMAEIVSRFCIYKEAKWFSHFHDNMPQLENFALGILRSKSKIANYYEKQLLYKRYSENGGNRFIAISRNAEKYAYKVLPKGFPVSYLKNAIDYQAFYLPVNEPLLDSPIRLINVGSFQKKKNQQFLIDVIKALKEKGIITHLTFLGDGKEMESVKNKALDLGVIDQISFEGNVTNVQKYLAESDIYLHSAYYEPFGLVILEAMAAGLPVVCLNGGGNEDFMKDGQNGFMLNEADYEHFAQSIQQLMANSELRQTFAINGQLTAKEYSIHKYCDKLIRLYEESLEKV